MRLFRDRQDAGRQSPRRWRRCETSTLSSWAFPGEACRWPSRWRGRWNRRSTSSWCASWVSRSSPSWGWEPSEKTVPCDQPECHAHGRREGRRTGPGRIPRAGGGGARARRYPRRSTARVDLRSHGDRRGRWHRHRRHGPSGPESGRARGAARVVLAVPVAPVDVVEALEMEADEVVCLQAPPEFYAIGEWYGDFAQVPDKRVVELLHRAAHELATRRRHPQRRERPRRRTTPRCCATTKSRSPQTGSCYPGISRFRPTRSVW